MFQSINLFRFAKIFRGSGHKLLQRLNFWNCEFFRAFLFICLIWAREPGLKSRPTNVRPAGEEPISFQLPPWSLSSRPKGARA